MIKVRLVKGPFGGKVMEFRGPEEIIVINGPKRMTRRQRYEEAISNRNYNYLPADIPNKMVRARYQKAIRPMSGNDGIMHYVHLQHPDGSFFYEFVKGSKEER